MNTPKIDGCSEPPDVLYFGWVSGGGHFLRSKNYPYPKYDSTPWGNQIDSGLAPRPDIVDGKISEHHKDGWTAIAFWDRSGDRRPNSNTAFFVPCTMTTSELLEWARKQWPDVFGRNGFPVK